MVQTTGPGLFDSGSNNDSLGPSTWTPPPTPVEIPEEAVEAQLAQGDFGGIGSVVAVTSGGLTINLLFDAAAMAAPASFRAGIQQAAALLSAAISDHITINLKIDYSGTGGGAAAGPDSGQWESYTSVRADLINYASPGDTAFNALPSGSTIQGQSSVAVWNAQLKLWGLLSANDTTTDDGSATFATDINPNLLVGVALHELTHAMGRVPYGSQPDVFDFYRFTSPGSRLFTGGATAAAAYFSLDGGNSKLADYGRSSDSSDFLNSGIQGANDPFNEFYSGSTLQTLTAIDLRQLDALGFHLTGSTGTVIQTDGNTSLVLVGSNYFLSNVNGGSSPLLRYGGAPVTVGEFGSLTPIGAIQTASGYDIAWKIPGSSSFTFWTTDSSGNYTSNLTGWVSGNNLTTELLERTFNQDFNGDGTVGPTASVVQTDRSTSLLQIADTYFLYVNGSGPSLKYGGAPVTVGEFGNVAVIGAVQTSTGYDIACKVPGANSFTFWTADSNGNYSANLTGWVSGNSLTSELLEMTFNQDFNGDGTFGPTSSVVLTDQSTSLLQIADTYFLYVNGSGPSLKYGGAPVTVGEFGNVAIVGAVQTATGYDIACNVPGSNSFTFWTADSDGNYTSNLAGWVSGNSLTAELLETTFNHDFNGDGTIGPTASVVQTDQSTNLLQIADTYFLYVNGAGPSLKYGGAPVTVGEFGNVAVVGAVQTATGYDIAWKMPGTSNFTFWTTDSNGNYTSNIVGWVSGTSNTVETLETTFHQDLNGDGVIGVPSSTSPSSVAGGSTETFNAATVEATSFTGSTLAVMAPSSSQIVGFGEGGGDQIDLRGVNFDAMHASFDNASSALGVTDGSTTVQLQFLGHYAQDSFHFADDGSGGTLVTSPTGPAPGAATTNPANVYSASGHDTFVFAPNFGQVSIANFTPATDSITFSHSVFSGSSALAAAIHDDSNGNAVIMDAAHDTITLQHVTTAQLLAHLTDFHIV